MKPTPLRVALLGAGRWGRNYIKTIPLVPGAELTRVASGNPETKGLVPASCSVDRDWRAVVAASDVDAVIVAAPAALHAEMASAALAAGKPVLLEKPTALTSADARRLLDEASKFRLPVLVDHVQLFHPAYVELKRRAQGLGPARAIVSSGANWGPFRADTSALWDYGSHDISLCLDLLGKDPSDVEASVVEERSIPEGQGQTVRVVLRFAGGLSAEILVGNLAPKKKRRFEVRFDAKNFVMDDLAPSKLVEIEGGQERPVAVAGDPPLARAVAAFVALVRSGKLDLSSLELGVRVVETLERCDKSISSRRSKK